MLFGGLQKLTTLDFPGVVSALLFTQGCNFHCPYCHNRQLIPQRREHGEEAMPERENVLLFLQKRRDVLDGLVISGGEPLLQPDLKNFCREVKTLGYKIKLDTNGSMPQRLAALLEENLLDYVAVDLKTSVERYSPTLTNDRAIGEKIAETFALLAKSATPFEARTTCFLPLTDAEALHAAATVLPPDTPWLLQRGNIPKGLTQYGPRPLDREEETMLLHSLQGAVAHCKIAARSPFAA